MAEKIVDYISGIEISATPEEIEATQVFSKLLRGCPACFLILKGVVISSHETNRFS